MNKFILITIFLSVLFFNQLRAIGNDGPSIATGKISGKVFDQTSNETLIGLAVVVQGTTLAAPTNIEGRYELKLAPGKYTVVFKYIGYTTKTISDVEVKPGEVTELNVALQDAAVQKQEVVVSASYKQESISALYSIQKNNIAISSGISSDVIKRSPDKNTSDVLKRVSGASIQDNKFVIIRGLSDRYNTALLNNAILPSSEPDRKAFSFDIIPSNMVDNIIINKTASADLPGDFAGGVIQIVTKDVPEQSFLNVSAGVGYNAISTGKTFTGNERTANDYLAANNEARTLNSAFPATRQEFSVGTLDNRLQASKLLGNPYAETQEKAAPSSNYQLTWGNNKRFSKNRSIGSIVGLNYRNSYLINQTERYDYDATGPFYKYLDTLNRYNTTVGAIANITYTTKATKLSFKNLYNQILDENYTSRGGAYYNNIVDVRYNQNERTERAMLNSQLEGDHRLSESGIKLGWNINRSTSTRQQPDFRTIYYSRPIGATADDDPTNDKFVVVDRNSRRAFLNLTEVTNGASANATLPFKFLGDKSLVKTGLLTQVKNRDFGARFFNYKVAKTFGNSTIDSVSKLDKDQVFSDSNISKKGFVLEEITSNDDPYQAKSNLKAAYLLMDAKLAAKLRMAFGARLESYQQGLNYIDKGGVAIATDTTYVDVLPSINLTYSLTPKVNLRVSASQTVTRPEFREIAPFEFYDYVIQGSVKGNVDLKRSLNTNLDARFEWYPSAGESFTVSGFYKNFENPIEQTVNPASNADKRIYEYSNAASALAKGIELEVRKKLNFTDIKWIQNITIFANVSYIQSDVLFTQGSSNAKRSLQGQSPYLFNEGIQYTGDKGLSLSLMHNFVGQRISTVGYLGYADIYERGRHIIDFQIAKKLMKQKAEFKLTLADILAQDEIFYQNNNTDKTYQENTDNLIRKTNFGANIGLSFSYNFDLGKKAE